MRKDIYFISFYRATVATFRGSLQFLPSVVPGSAIIRDYICWCPGICVSLYTYIIKNPISYTVGHNPKTQRETKRWPCVYLQRAKSIMVVNSGLSSSGHLFPSTQSSTHYVVDWAEEHSSRDSTSLRLRLPGLNGRGRGGFLSDRETSHAAGPGHRSLLTLWGKLIRWQ